MKSIQLKRRIKKALTGIAIASQLIMTSFIPLVAQAGILFPESNSGIRQ